MTYQLCKRAFDVFCSACGLLILSPFCVLIAVLIKVSDGGPVFFKQVRIGQFGRTFRILKFRSMVVNADKIGTSVTADNDPRITMVGRFLRKTKLDELPQLWNVLTGDMSLVGPRPEVPKYVERYTPEQRRILDLKPGITDVASLLFRNEEELLRGAGDVDGFYVRYCLPKKIQLNVDYARRASLLNDIFVILQTVFPYWIVVLAVYFVCLSFGLWMSYELKADFRAGRREFEEFSRFLLILVFPQLIFLVWRGQLRGLLSYFSLPEMKRTVFALAAALVLQIALCYSLQGRLVPSASTLLMDFVLSCFTLAGVRMGLRVLREHASRPRVSSNAKPHRIAIIGTGQLATNLLLDFSRSDNPARSVVALFDDDARTWNKRRHGVPVEGMPECLLHREWWERVDEVIITLPEEQKARIQELEEMLKGSPFRVTIASGWPVLETV